MLKLQNSSELFRNPKLADLAAEDYRMAQGMGLVSSEDDEIKPWSPKSFLQALDKIRLKISKAGIAKNANLALLNIRLVNAPPNQIIQCLNK